MASRDLFNKFAIIRLIAILTRPTTGSEMVHLAGAAANRDTELVLSTSRLGWPAYAGRLPKSWNNSSIYPNVKKFKHDYPGEHSVRTGAFVNESFVCSNAAPRSKLPARVTNITEKITGSDGDFFVDKMKTFVGKSVAASQSFSSGTYVHYIRLPRPAMPTFMQSVSTPMTQTMSGLCNN